MNRLFFLLATVFIVSTSMAQSGATPRLLKKTITLKMALTADDDMPGTRGASVAWHPVLKKYYAAMAGNVGYPLCVFDAAGKRLSKDDHITDADVRGLWYNVGKKAIQGNTYGENGWFQYKLKTNGMVEELEEIQAGKNQPNDQCVGAFYTPTKEILFFDGSKVFFYNSETAEVSEESLVIHWGRKKADGPAEDEDEEVTPEGYNNTTLVFTAIKGAELAFLNSDAKTIELYDIKSGFLTKTLSLPEEAVTETSFNFSFTNGAYWLFDMDSRTWTGYK
jgi:hypothetical protein